MTEPRHVEAEAPIEDIGLGPSDVDTGAEHDPPGEQHTDPNDPLEAFKSRDGEGFFPDPPPGSAPQLDEGVQ